MTLAAATILALALLGLVDPRVARLWLNTALLAGGACLVALPLGFLLAIILFKTDAPGRGFVTALLVGMLFVPLYLVTGAWDAGFGIQGWHTLVSNPHLAHEPWLAGWRAAVWVHGLAAVPWVVLIVGAALRAVEAELEEDAATCAAPWLVIWHVSVPRAAPALAIAALWIATVVMTEISVTDFFQVRTFAEEVYTQSALGTFDMSDVAPPSRGGMTSSPSSTPISTSLPALSAVGLWSGVLLSTALALVVITSAARLFSDIADAPHRPAWIWRLKRGRWVGALVLAACVLLIVGVPLANLVYKAGVQVTATDAGRVRHWSLVKLFTSLASAIGIELQPGTTKGSFLGEIQLSSIIGAGAATAALIIATPLAWCVRDILAQERRPGRGRRVQWLVLLAISVCLTLPGPLLGLGVIRLLNRPPDSPLGALAWLYDSNFAPWLVQTIRALPIVTLVLWPALASVPQTTLDAAAMDGAGWWSRLLRIAVPQRWPAFAAAWLFALAIAMGELAATVLVMPPQRETALSIRVFQDLHYGVDDRVAAICLVMMAVIATLTGIAAVLLKRKCD